MIFSKSWLKVADNSGVKFVKCVRVLQTTSASGRLSFAGVGDIILTSARLTIFDKKIDKGTLFKAVIVRTKRIVKRRMGFILFKDNAVVLLNKKMLPVGTRVFGPIAHEVRNRSFSKIIALAVLLI